MQNNFVGNRGTFSKHLKSKEEIVPVVSAKTGESLTESSGPSEQSRRLTQKMPSTAIKNPNVPKNTFSGANPKSSRMGRPTEKQVAEDLQTVQNQVDRVMRNIETFEIKKRDHSQRKTNKAGVQNKVTPQVNTFANVVKVNELDTKPSDV